MGDALRDAYGLDRSPLPGRRGSTWVVARSHWVDTRDPSAVPACDDAYERHQAAALAALNEPPPAAADGRTDPTAGDGANEPSRPAHGAHSGPAEIEYGVRVDRPHPRRRERAGDLMTHLGREKSLRCREFWDGWTPVVRTVTPWVEADALRTWDLPPEPGPEVTAVRDCNGHVWTRLAWNSWHHNAYRLYWRDLFDNGLAPLTDASGEA
jgi:hypothetical protein